MGKICYIMGKSSSGKDTIFKRLKEKLPQLKTITLYTTRPARAGEMNGLEYYFTDDAGLKSMQDKNLVIELRAYDTVHGVWKYFTADDGQIDLDNFDYIVIGTLESYAAMRAYLGAEKLLPVYVEVDDGVRLSRALEREKTQSRPKYSEMCRRFLADQEDFSEENLREAGIHRKFVNEDLEKCLEEIESYLNQELSK